MIKPGVEFIFEQYPELPLIGTPEQYSKYLDTVFPSSKVKDIVYHGAMEQMLPKDGIFKGYVTYFTDAKKYAETFGFPINRKILAALINIQFPYISPSELADVPEEIHITDEFTNPRLIKRNTNNYDSVIGIDAGQKEGKTIAVFNPKQIHILGSKQDIDGFKKFVFKEKNMAEAFSKEWWTNILNLDESKASTEVSPYYQLVLDEMEELERTSQEFNIPLPEIQYAFETGKEVILSEDIWSKLENTDSYKIKNLEQAIKIAEKYEKNWKKIVDAIKAEIQLPLPMILNWGEGKYYLVAGNTRLMIYRALKLQPVVLMANMNLLTEEESSVFDINTIKLDKTQKATIRKFIKYVTDFLELQNIPSNLVLSYDNDEAKKRHSFGYHNRGDNKIWVYVKNRNMADILRTLGHELVHHRQAELGMLDAKSGETGSPIENEANAIAGILLREFGKKNKEIYEHKIR